MSDEIRAEHTFEIIPHWILHHGKATLYTTCMYLHLRWRANNEGVAWPSVSRMAADLGWAPNTVRKAIRDLEEMNAISVESVYVNGMQSSNRYTVRMSREVLQEMKGGTSRGEGGYFTESKTNLDPLNLDTMNKQTLALADASASVRVTGAFDEFYSLYPRKTGKQAAAKAWAKAVKVTGDPQIIIAGVARFALDPNLPEKEYIPHPSRWLNEGRWDDEPLPARGVGESRRMQEAKALHQRLVATQAPTFGELGA